MSLEKIPVKTTSDIKKLYKTVQLVWREVFTPIIGKEQVTYMLKHYQSIEAITKEINKGANYFLLIHDGASVGYTAYEETARQIYISKLYLISSSRGKGLSSAIFDWYDTLANHKTLHLNVNKNNQLAIAIYEHRGFKRMGERHVDIGGGFTMDDYIYEK